MSFSITDLSIEEVNIILGGLGELPFKISNGVVKKIQEQVIPQVQEAERNGTLSVPSGNDNSSDE